MNYNSTPNESTKYAPYTLVYGAEARGLNELTTLDIDAEPIHDQIRELAANNMKEAAEKSKKYYDLHHKPQDFELYDKVLIRRDEMVRTRNCMNDGKALPLSSR